MKSRILSLISTLPVIAALLLPGASSARAEDEAISANEEVLQWLHGRRTPVLRKFQAASTVHYCQGGIFEPCVCWRDVTKDVGYRPSEPRCGKSTYPGDTAYNSAVILRGRMKSSFSTVVRTYMNADRSPYEPALCTYQEFKDGLSKCSRWKEQRKFMSKGEMVVCLGASGYSKIFKEITRITIKISDIPDASGQKPLVRLCLRRPWLPLN